MIAGWCWDLIEPYLRRTLLNRGVERPTRRALLEEFAYGPDAQLLAGSLIDYLLPTAAETPEMRVLVTEDAPSPLHPLGIKGAGEGGIAAAGAVIANAVSDALGAEVTALPITPELVVRLARASPGAPVGHG